MYGYVYLITNQLNGKQYVGQHKYDKPEIDKNYWAGGIIINESLKKYGHENFTRECLDFADSKSELDDLECYYIKLLSPEYNIASGGQGGFLGEEVECRRKATFQTLEYRQKCSKAFKGRKLTEEQKLRISQSKMGHEVSEEARRKISLSNRGKKHTEEWKRQHSEQLKGRESTFKGKHHREESKKKCSDSMKAYCASHPERNQKISEANRGRKYSTPRKGICIICVETGVMFPTIKAASERMHINASFIGQCLKGQTPSTKGYHWEYYKGNTN